MSLQSSSLTSTTDVLSNHGVTNGSVNYDIFIPFINLEI